MDFTYVEGDLENPAHRIAVRDLVDAYARDPMGTGGRLPQETLDRLVPGLHAHPSTLIYLAFQGEMPAGVAVCFVGFSTFAARPLVNVHDLVVLAPYRRRGVARGLLQCVEARARALDCCKLTLEVLEDNAAARALYRSFGFADADAGGGAPRTLFLERPLG